MQQKFTPGNLNGKKSQVKIEIRWHRKTLGFFFTILCASDTDVVQSILKKLALLNRHKIEQNLQEKR